MVRLLLFYNLVTKPYHSRLIILFIFPIIWCLAETAAPYMIKIVIDDLSSHKFATIQFSEHLLWPMIWYFILMITMEASIRICSYLWIRFIPQIRAIFREKTLSEVTKQPLSYFQAHSTGDLITKFKNLSNSFDQLLSNFLYGIFPVCISSLAAFAFLYVISPLFSAFFLIWFLGMLGVTFLFTQKSISVSDQYATRENKLLGFVADIFRNMILVKTSPTCRQDQSHLSQLQSNEIHAARQVEWTTYKADSLRSIISVFMLLGMVMLLAWGWQSGKLTLGDFSFITVTCFYVRRSAWTASINLLMFFKEMGVAQEALDELLQQTNDKTKHHTRSSPDMYDITISDICFGYPSENKILDKFNLYISQGEKVLIMGESGCGKTTLAYLLLNLLYPNSGKILIGGSNTLYLSNTDLSKVIKYVPQSAPLFHRTIRENLLYGNESVTEQMMVQACTNAQAHNFITNLQGGYNAEVGEGGAMLSGGQCQRLSIARALLKSSPIMILDEATSALDTKTESQILQHILQNKEQTLIFISHKEQHKDLFDRVIQLMPTTTQTCEPASINEEAIG
jgi:ABC-type multidrug transport system fused ATPase/permease subunit